MRTGKIGSVSTGTMLPEDLVDALSSELSELVEGGEYTSLLSECADWLSQDEDSRPDGDELVSDLFDALNEAAPDFCYFGAIEGDGADYGFWPSDDALRDSVHDGETLSCGDGRHETPMPGFILHTSDHGNQSLYRVKLEMVW
jgi:hypothetical protein